MQVCLWDLSEGRSDVVDSVWTGSVGFCQCSILDRSPGSSLLAFAGKETEEVGTFTCALVLPDQRCQMKGHVLLISQTKVLFERKIFKRPEQQYAPACVSLSKPVRGTFLARHFCGLLSYLEA